MLTCIKGADQYFPETPTNSSTIETPTNSDCQNMLDTNMLDPDSNKIVIPIPSGQLSVYAIKGRMPECSMDCPDLSNFAIAKIRRKGITCWHINLEINDYFLKAKLESDHDKLDFSGLLSLQDLLVYLMSLKV